MLHKIGKILFLLLITIPLYSSVELIAPKKITKGESVIFKIVAKGFKIKFPKIEFIDGCVVEEINSESEAYMLGTGKATKVTKSYQFITKKTLTIPSFSLEIDGVIENTKVQEIKVQKISKTISDNYDLQMHVSKAKAYVGEKLILKVVFTYKDVEDYDVLTPKFPDFSVEELDEKSYKSANGDYHEEIKYTLMPLKAGKFSLPGSRAEVETLKKGYTHKNNRSKYIKKLSVYSNGLNLDILALPENISVVGSYEMSSRVLNKQLKFGEALRVKFIIRGNGNIDNLDAFTFEIPNATVYDKGMKKDKKANQDYFTKDFEIISKEDFRVPSLSLSYFDTLSQKVENLRTPSYFIEIEGAEKSSKNREMQGADVEKSSHNSLEKKFKEDSLRMIEKIIYFVMGVIGTSITVLIYKFIKKLPTRKSESRLIQELNKTQTQEAFFKKVVPFVGKNHTLDCMIFALEKEDEINFKKLKKELINSLRDIL